MSRQRFAPNNCTHLRIVTNERIRCCTKFGIICKQHALCAYRSGGLLCAKQ